MNYTITFTNEEAQALVQLLDIALKSGGLQVSKPVQHFIEKLEAVKPEETEETNNIKETI